MQVRILVVEDQSDISDIVVKYLQKEGYETTLAKDGFEALELFGSQRFHLVLLDIMMPASAVSKYCARFAAYPTFRSSC